ncbi:hypothetical protein PM082_004131 [Marasmius tenuissimus]|nr:hypothetical protein PM082_004131 [Marasmius tenuissimus]
MMVNSKRQQDKRDSDPPANVDNDEVDNADDEDEDPSPQASDHPKFTVVPTSHFPLQPRTPVRRRRHQPNTQLINQRSNNILKFANFIDDQAESTDDEGSSPPDRRNRVGGLHPLPKATARLSLSPLVNYGSDSDEQLDSFIVKTSPARVAPAAVEPDEQLTTSQELSHELQDLQEDQTPATALSQLFTPTRLSPPPGNQLQYRSASRRRHRSPSPSPIAGPSSAAVKRRRVERK